MTSFVILRKCTLKYHHNYFKLNLAEINAYTTLSVCSTLNFNYFSLSRKYAKFDNLQTVFLH